MPFSTATSFKGLRLRVGKNEAADDFLQDLNLTSFVTDVTDVNLAGYSSDEVSILKLSVTKDEIVTCCAQSSVATSLDFFTLANPLRYHKAADPKALSNR